MVIKGLDALLRLLLESESIVTEIIYETKGRAREYCELSANLYRGCDHGCTYCYAPLATRRNRDDFIHPTIRKDALSKLEKDAKKLANRGEKRPILLSFTTDPYQHFDEVHQVTRRAIEILHANNLKITILTKGGRRSERDFDLLSLHPDLSEYGTTLVFTDERLREQIEPNAAPTNERIRSLKKAHNLGIFTFVSLEPVWNPEQSLALIKKTHKFVDFYKVGKLNYNPQQSAINWKLFRDDAIAMLSELGKDYYIKKDLQKY